MRHATLFYKRISDSVNKDAAADVKSDKKSIAQGPKAPKKKTVFKRIWEIVSLIALVAILAATVHLLAAKAMGTVPFFFGKSIAYVVTGSMEPTIPTRSFVLIEKVDPSDIEAGDVIMFVSSDPAIYGEYNVHRVFSIDEGLNEFVTKGDANPTVDAYTVKAEDVRARYVRNCPVISTLISWFLTKAGLVITLVLIFAVCLAVYLPDVLRKNVSVLATEEAEKKKKMDEMVADEVEKLKQAALSGKPIYIMKKVKKQNKHLSPRKTIKRKPG